MYIIYLQLNNKVQSYAKAEPNETSIVFDHLNACTQYKISITAVDMDKDEGFTDSLLSPFTSKRGKLIFRGMIHFSEFPLFLKVWMWI